MGKQLGTITFGDGTSAKVELVKEQTYSSLPSDYWLKYQEGETNKQLIHPGFGKEDYILSEILLPEFLYNKYVKLD